MKKINLAITGCLGRMGKQLIKSSKSEANFKLVSITENRIINKKVSGLRPQLNSESAFKNANIIIDFTIPKCTLEMLKIASKLRKRVVIGTTIEVPTIDGGKAKVKIPAGTQNGKQFRLKSKGMPMMRNKDYGDLYIRAITEVPVSLTKEQKNLLEQFKKLEDSKTNPTIKNFFEKAKRFWKN